MQRGSQLCQHSLCGHSVRLAAAHRAVPLGVLSVSRDEHPARRVRTRSLDSVLALEPVSSSPQSDQETVTAGLSVSHGTWVSTPSPSSWAQAHWWLCGWGRQWGRQQLSSCYPSQQPLWACGLRDELRPAWPLAHVGLQQPQPAQGGSPAASALPPSVPCRPSRRDWEQHVPVRV